MNLRMEQLGFFYLLFLFLFLIFSFLLLNIITKTNKTTKREVPPGPWRLPIIGNLHLLNLNKPHHSLINLSNKHGPLILLHLGSIPTLVVSSRDIAKEIFTNHDLTFSSRPLLTAPKKLAYNCSSISFAPYGDLWRQARKIAMLELLSSRRVRSFEAVRREEVEKLIVTIKDQSIANLSELTLSFANNVVCRAALGHEFGDGGYFRKGGVWLHQQLSETQSLLGGFCVADFFPGMEWLDRLRGFHGRLEKNFEEMDKFLDRVIHEHLKMSEKEEASGNGTKDSDEEEKDLVHVLLRLHKAAILHGGFLSNVDHVKAILVEAFIAGTDTSSATITWTMTQLIKNPRVMMKLQEELKQVTNGNSHRLIQESELEKLEYLKQVIKESLRLKPPVPLLIPHETIKACEIQGYMIPACTRVIFNIAAISTDPNVWEKPLEFWPERFEGRDVDFKGHDFELLSFGSGRRKCPGINFAMVIIELALANLLHCFNWSIPDGMKAEDINMEEAIGITTHKKDALCLVAKSKW
ncbi:hypothetical protein IEQ34_009278 [Dendrobium chrysotoxum]|uniref:Cytochrome P450 n=1 Tax=Dendrobium chrysotoxum TaxID=161865 RepID=A0AAV7H1E3_DENCH|nr:hypothetical protein IEQ34_009278 [Dendrobium chrysotoxum]